MGLLANGLVERGHQVSLFASGDSETAATLHAVHPHSLRTDPSVAVPFVYECASVLDCAREAKSFDVIHNHAGLLPMFLAELLPTPMLTTLHGPLPAGSELAWRHYDGFYNTISRAAKQGLPERGYVGAIHNGVDVACFPFRAKKDDYLLFLGRISPEKGVHHAIDVARRLGRRLIVAGKVDRVDRTYFSRSIKPRIDGGLISFIGEADAQRKRTLLASAAGLLNPITWSEPFGLVMVEAMACWTPVIVFNRGSAPEVVIHGETGYVVGDLEG
ncbi:MAG: glycosyltransferase family 4 protein, partial [Chloroflexota bacterium]